MGVVASSMRLADCEDASGAVLGRGVVGVVESAFEAYVSGASCVVLTERKVVILMIVPWSSFGRSARSSPQDGIAK